MAEKNHLIVTVHEGYGFSAESPQLPGFIMGRDTETEFLRDYERVLRDVDLWPVVGHRQWRFATPEGAEYLVRARDEDQAERRSIFKQVLSVLQSDQRSALLDSTRANATGEYLFICSLPGDRLGDVAAELSTPEHTAMLVAPASVLGVWTMPLSVSSAGPDSWESLSQLGLSLDSTVGSLMTSVGTNTAARGLALAA